MTRTLFIPPDFNNPYAGIEAKNNAEMDTLRERVGLSEKAKAQGRAELARLQVDSRMPLNFPQRDASDAFRCGLDAFREHLKCMLFESANFATSEPIPFSRPHENGPHQVSHEDFLLSTRNWALADVSGPLSASDHGGGGWTSRDQVQYERLKKYRDFHERRRKWAGEISAAVYLERKRKLQEAGLLVTMAAVSRQRKGYA